MMAARWKEFEKDGDNYYLQYRTVGDKRVRKTHRMLHNITLPFPSKFWDKYFPPNGWNCRCTVVQVRKDKYKMSDETAAMNAGSQATAGKHQEMFMFNPGKEMTTFPAYNAYTIKSCKTCPYKLGNLTLVKANVPFNDLCASCKLLHHCIEQEGCYNDEIYGERLRISKQADQKEVEDNVRAARVLLSSFPNMTIKVREDVKGYKIKNPEYLINDLVGDRKGIESENGVASGFNKAIKQGCKVVVIDLDMHPERFPILRTHKLSSAIRNRFEDFENNIIAECYIIFNGKSTVINKECFTGERKSSQEKIIKRLEKIKSDRSHS